MKINLEEALRKIEQKDQIIIDMKTELEAYKKRCEELEKIVTACTNSFIPSSKRIIKETASDEPKEPKKKGAPIGHPGTTRETSEQDSEKIINPTSCPFCNGMQIKALKQRKKIVEDIEILKHTTMYTYFECRCEECNALFTTTHPEMPIEGRFGPNISALWTLLHYKGTIPFDRLSSISASGFKMPVSVGGIQNVIYRNAQTFKPEFNKIWKNVSESKYAKSDETGYSFNGERYWVWNISAGNDTLVLMRKSRGSKVLKEVFGEFFDGVLLSDCFSAYGKFNAKEYAKCWAHILVAGQDLAKYSSEGKELHAILCRMYEYVKNAKKNNLENTYAVKQWISRAIRKIILLSKTEYGSKAVLNLALRLEKYKEQWFTCLKYPEVEPTNNGSERDIRKIVLSRKVSGLHRSVLGIRSREIMMSVLLTAQKKGQNPYAYVQNGIMNYNSGNKGS